MLRISVFGGARSFWDLEVGGYEVSTTASLALLINLLTAWISGEILLFE
jgi:hypothetical protein